jgi:hypothetical protein
MNYKNYRIEDFVLDPFFRDWVLKRCYQMNIFWLLWMNHHPERLNEIYEARMILYILNPDDTAKIEQTIDPRWQEICN